MAYPPAQTLSAKWDDSETFAWRWCEAFWPPPGSEPVQLLVSQQVVDRRAVADSSCWQQCQRKKNSIEGRHVVRLLLQIMGTKPLHESACSSCQKDSKPSTLFIPGNGENIRNFLLMRLSNSSLNVCSLHRAKLPQASPPTNAVPIVSICCRSVLHPSTIRRLFPDPTSFNVATN